MPGSLERYSSTQITPVGSGGLRRRTSRALANLEEHTLMRVAGVQATAYVQTEKVKEVDRLAREAMTGQVMLRRWADTLAGDDPTIASELLFFSDMAKVGKAEIIADTIDAYCREGR